MPSESENWIQKLIQKPEANANPKSESKAGCEAGCKSA